MSTATLEAPAQSNVELVLSEIFKENDISHNRFDLEIARDIISKCKQENYTAFQAATTICEELNIEMRFNRTLLEKAIISHKLLKSI